MSKAVIENQSYQIVPNCVMNGQNCKYIIRQHIKKMEVHFNEFEKKKKQLDEIEKQLVREMEREITQTTVVNLLNEDKQILKMRLAELQKESEILFRAYKNEVKCLLKENDNIKPTAEKPQSHVQTIILRQIKQPINDISSSSSSSYADFYNRNQKVQIPEVESKVFEIKKVKKGLDFASYSPRKQLFSESNVNKAEFYNLNRDIVSSQSGTISRIGRDKLSPFQSRVLPEINRQCKKEAFLDVQAVVYKVLEKGKEKEMILTKLHDYFTKEKIKEYPKKRIIEIENEDEDE